MAIPKAPNVPDMDAAELDLFAYQQAEQGGVSPDTNLFSQDAATIPQTDLPESEYDVVNPVYNPDHELMQLASTGQLSRLIGKGLSLDFLTGGVLGQSAKVLRKKEELVDLGLPPDMTRQDLIEIKPDWKPYMIAPEDYGQNSFLVDLNAITPIRERTKGVLNAKKFMQLAENGEQPKRGPVILKQNEDGSFELRDGNSTYAVAKQSGWGEIPAIVMDDAQFAKYEADKAAEKLKKQEQMDGKRDEADVVIESATDDATIDSATQGTINSAEGQAIMDGATAWETLLENDRNFADVEGRIYDDGKNIFGEVAGGGQQSDEILDAATDPTVRDGVFENQAAGVVDEQGGLIDFRAYGMKGGQINPADQKIPDEGTVYTTLNAISENGNYRARIEAGGRDAVTQKATEELATVLGMKPRALAKTILNRQNGGVIFGDGANGTTGLAEYMLAARQLLVNEAGILDELAHKAVTGTDADKLAFRAQLELVAQLQAQIKGSQTEIARALASFKIPTRDSNAQSLVAGDIRGILDEYGGIEDVADMANAYLQGGDLTQRLAVTREASKFKKFSDGFYEAWINILLSSPVTHIKNVAGAFLTTFAHTGETMAQVGFNRVGMAFGGRDSGVRMADAQAQMFGLVMAVQDAFGAAGRGFKYGEKVTAGSKLEGGSSKYRANAFATDKGGMYGSFVNGMGRVMTLDRIPTRLLEFEDNLFKVMGIRQSLYEQAMRSGNSKGLKGDALAEHIADFVHNPPADALKQAETHAKYTTLQTDLDRLGKDLSGIRNNAIMRFFVPFFKTPYNATKYALVERTPLGLMSKEISDTIERGKAPNATIEERVAGQKAQTRMAMGSMTMVAVASLAAMGHITGNGPADPELRDTMIRSGWRPYSIKIGDKYYSYQGAEPFSSVISLAADGAEVMFNKSLDDEDGEKVALALTVMMANQVTDKTFMQGFSTFVNTLSDPTRYAGQMGDNFIRSLVPRSVALIEKQVDPTQRMARDTISQLQAQIPWLSENLEPRRNLWGQKVMVGDAAGPDILSPIYVSHLGEQYANDKGTDAMPDRGQRAYKIDKEFLDIRWSPSDPPETLNFPKIGKLEMTDKQLGLFQEVLGQMAIQEFEALIAEPEYQAMKNEAMKSSLGKEILVSAYQKAYIGAKKRAQAWMIGEADRGDDELFGASPYATLFQEKIKKIGNLIDEKERAYDAAVGQ